MEDYLTDGIESIKNNTHIKKLHTRGRRLVSVPIIKKTLTENDIQCSRKYIPLVEDILLGELYKIIHKLKFNRVKRINNKTIKYAKGYNVK